MNSIDQSSQKIDGCNGTMYFFVFELIEYGIIVFTMFGDSCGKSWIYISPYCFSCAIKSLSLNANTSRIRIFFNMNASRSGNLFSSAAI